MEPGTDPAPEVLAAVARAAKTYERDYWARSVGSSQSKGRSPLSDTHSLPDAD